MRQPWIQFGRKMEPKDWDPNNLIDAEPIVTGLRWNGSNWEVQLTWYSWSDYLDQANPPNFEEVGGDPGKFWFHEDEVEYL